MQPSVPAPRTRNRKTFKAHDSMNPPGVQMENWGQWQDDLHYSLEVAQHPLRARMCGFGDKDRRPLAPAAVAKMVVRRRDDSHVDPDDIDVAFFLVTVDLWSEAGTEEMNLVLHPSSGGHATNSNLNTRRPKKPPTTPYSAPTSAAPYDSQPSTSSAVRPSYQPHPEGRYAPRSHDDAPGYHQRSETGEYLPPGPDGTSYQGPSQDPHTQTQYPQYDEQRGNWPPSYPPNAGPSNAPPATGSSPAPAEHASYQTLPPIGTLMSSPGPHTQHAPPPHPHPHQRPYPPGPPPAQWGYSGQNQGYVDPALQQPPHPHAHHPPPGPAPGQAYPDEGYSGGAPGSPYYVQTPAALHGAAVAAQHDPGSSTAGGQYTRTLVGPLSANASKLTDDHKHSGIFFLFQDLSVRTEGTFRLRMRLMNVGAPPAPNAHATRVTTTSTPILAQVFTDPFTVFSAKRFPGVPETTSLSLAFGTQGQKLPLRNRHPGSSSAKKRGRKGRGGGSDSAGDTDVDSNDSQGSN